MSIIKNNLALIQKVLEKHGSAAEIIAVCKKQPLDNIIEVINLGINNLGINYINEFLEQKEKLQKENINWHYIGSIQSNKLNKIVGQFHMIHSVGRIKSVEKIDQLAKKLGIVQKILFQLNLSGEPTKSGFTLSEYKEVTLKMKTFNNVLLCGLMTMPPEGEGEKYFKEMLRLKKESKESGQSSMNCDIKYLSMGTSGDFEEAVKFGATHIRLGTVLLGTRN